MFEEFYLCEEQHSCFYHTLQVNHLQTLYPIQCWLEVHGITLKNCFGEGGLKVILTREKEIKLK